MYSSENENDLIVNDVVQTVRDYVGVQPDINEQKLKTCWWTAQELDVDRVLCKLEPNWMERCLNPVTVADKKLKRLLIPALSNYCYARALGRHQGTLTDGGYMVDKEATDLNTAKSSSNNFKADAEEFMTKVINFLASENPNTTTDTEAKAKLTPNVRVIGGEERRASN